MCILLFIRVSKYRIWNLHLILSRFIIISRDRLFALNWIISIKKITHEIYRETLNQLFPIRSSIYTSTSKNLRANRPMKRRLLTFPLAIQCNRWDNWQAVPANDGTIIRRVGVLWIFKLPSRPWHGSAFLCHFARFRDQLIDALLRRSAQTRRIFTCVAIQRKVTSFPKIEDNHFPFFYFLC